MSRTIYRRLPTIYSRYRGLNNATSKPYCALHLISTNAKMSNDFAELLSERVSDFRDAGRWAKLLTGQTFPFRDRTGNRYIYNLATKIKLFEKPNLPILSLTPDAMKSHARLYEVSNIAIPKIGCGLDQINWQEVLKLLGDSFAYSIIRFVVYTLEENGVHALSSQGDPDFCVEDEIEIVQWRILLE